MGGRRSYHSSDWPRPLPAKGRQSSRSMKVRTLVARHPGGAITPKNDWRLYAENAVAPLRRKSGGAITPKTKWLLYAGNSHWVTSPLGARAVRLAQRLSGEAHRAHSAPGYA